MKIIHAHFRIHYFWACLLVFCFGLAFPLAAQNNTASAYRQEHSRIKVFILPPWNLEQTGLAADAAGASGADAAGAAAGEAGDVAAAGCAVAGEAAAKEAEYQRILQSAVSSSLASAGFSRTDADDWRQQAEKAQSDDVFGALPLLAAREAYHDIALAVYYRIEEPRIFIMVKAYDVRRKRLIAAQVEIARSGLVLITAIDRIMESVVAELAVAADDIIYMQDNPGVATGTSAAKVVFVSKQEGMLLSIPGLGSVGAIQNGQAELPYQPLAMGQELEILKEAEGYYPQTQTFQIRDTFNQIYLKDLHPHSRHAAELNYNAWTALGLGLAYRYIILEEAGKIKAKPQKV